MSLSTEQIAEIKKFINSRGFTYIEVEMEILDHVASAIEDKLTLNPGLSLQKAIHEVHASFGIFGFSTIEDEKQGYFHTLIKKEFLRNLKSFFLKERILTNLSIILGLVMLAQFSKYFQFEHFRVLPFICATVFTVVISFKYYWKFRKWKNKSLMLSATVMPLYIFQPQFGNFIGFMTEDIAESNLTTALLFLVGTSYLLILVALTTYYTMNWGYQWTYERYLKYAT